MDGGEISVGVLRECFRNLIAWRALYETDGVAEVEDADGHVICLWDIEYLYEQLPKLPTQQAKAIELCLVRNVKEREAAVMMGVSDTNPVAMYATLGLKKLVAMIEDGSLPRFRSAAPWGRRTA